MDDVMRYIVEAIGSVGFPIVVSGALFWYMTKSNESHKQEIDKLSEAVNNNTVVIQKLIDKLEKWGLKCTQIRDLLNTQKWYSL